MGHGGEFWQNVFPWIREWQATSLFLLWEPFILFMGYETVCKGAMPNKSLIQYSVDMWSIRVKPSCLSWGQIMVGVMMSMENSFKMTLFYTVVFSAPDPSAGHCQHRPSPEATGHSLFLWFYHIIGSFKLYFSSPLNEENNSNIITKLLLSEITWVNGL